MRVGITGNEGFIGAWLTNTIKLFPDEFELIHFEKGYFDELEKLNQFVERCDVIVHLAAMNRHSDPAVIYETNMVLVKRLINALDETNSKGHILFSSTRQEENGSVYGESKKQGRRMFSEWAKRSGGKFTGMVIPNVFGPFGKPYYNSFIATFCHQLVHDEQPKIETDAIVKLIYIDDLVKHVINVIRAAVGNDLQIIEHSVELSVSEILKLLESFKKEYLDNGIIPFLDNAFGINLFNTFRSFIDIKKYFPVKFTKHSDNRGAFVELIRLKVGGQVSFSTTAPGVIRGNHFHIRKIERFAVIKGKATIELRKYNSNKKFFFELDGDEPSYVDMPIWYTHNIKNTGNEDLYTIFWINEFFDPADPDTYFEVV